jgi:parallel beta-helix repeat protein
LIANNTFSFNLNRGISLEDSGSNNVVANNTASGSIDGIFLRSSINNMVLNNNAFNNIYGAMMRDWYTPDRVVEVLQRCEAYGMNAYNYFHTARYQSDWERYLAAGGKMHVVAQAMPNLEVMVKAVKPMGAWLNGEITDTAFHARKMEPVRDYCKLHIISHYVAVLLGADPSGNPFHVLPIGKKEIIETFKPDTLRRFYKDWYRPDLMGGIGMITAKAMAVSRGLDQVSLARQDKNLTVIPYLCLRQPQSG